MNFDLELELYESQRAEAERDEYESDTQDEEISLENLILPLYDAEEF